MKRWFSLMLLGILLVHVAGFYVYFFIRLSQIHVQAKAAIKSLPREQFEFIRLTKEDFKRNQSDDDEIRLDGKMFDIAFAEESGDYINIYALHDTAEDNLLAFVKAIINNASHDNAPVPVILVQFSTLYFITPDVAILPCARGFHDKGFTLYFKQPVAPGLESFSPPPEFEI